MKYLIAILLMSQMATAQVGTAGGLQTPLQMSTNALTALFKTLKSDSKLMLWGIKKISMNDNLIKVEFETDERTCAALLYEIKISVDEKYKVELVTDALVTCSK